VSNFLVFGSAAMDMTFSVRSALPSAGESVQGSFDSSPGGKGLYQAVASARLSHRSSSTTFISAVGKDAFGDQISELLRIEHITDHMQWLDLPSKATNMTDVVGVFSATGSPTSYIGCREATDRLSVEYVKNETAAIDAADAILITFDMAVEATQEIVALAKKAGKKIVINASPPNERMPLSVVQGVDYVVATLKEAAEWLRLAGGLSAEDVENLPEEAIGLRIQEQGARNVIITLDDAGCVVVDGRGSRHYEAYSIIVRMGGTGARSAFCAALMVALADPIDIPWAPISTAPELNLIATASAARYFANQRSARIQAMPYRSDLEKLFEQVPPLKLISERALQQGSKSPDLKVVGSKPSAREKTS
jgi:ribokinase